MLLDNGVGTVVEVLPLPAIKFLGTYVSVGLGTYISSAQ